MIKVDRYDALHNKESELNKTLARLLPEEKLDFIFSDDFESYCFEISSEEFSTPAITSDDFLIHLKFLTEKLGLDSTSGQRANDTTYELRFLVAERVVWSVIPNLVRFSITLDTSEINTQTKSFIEGLVCSSLSPKEIFSLATEQIASLVEGSEGDLEFLKENESRLEWVNFWLKIINEFGIQKITTVVYKFYQTLFLGFHGWFKKLRECQMSVSLYRKPCKGISEMFFNALEFCTSASKINSQLALQFLLELLGLSLQGESSETDFALHEFENQNPRYRTATPSPDPYSASVWHGYTEASRIITSLDADLKNINGILSEPVYEASPEVLFRGLLIYLFCSKKGSSVSPLSLSMNISISKATLDLLCFFQLRDPYLPQEFLEKLLSLWAKFVVECHHERLRFVAYNCLSRISAEMPAVKRLSGLAGLASRYKNELFSGVSETPPGALAMVVRLLQDALIKLGFEHLEEIWPVLSPLSQFGSYCPPSENISEIVWFVISHLTLFSQLIAFYGLAAKRIPSDQFKDTFSSFSTTNFLVPLRSYLEIIKSFENLEDALDCVYQLLCQLDMILFATPEPVADMVLTNVDQQFKSLQLNSHSSHKEGDQKELPCSCDHS